MLCGEPGSRKPGGRKVTVAPGPSALVQVMLAALVTLAPSNRNWMLPGQLTDVPRLRITMLTVGPGFALSELADGKAEAIKAFEEAGAVVGTKSSQLSCKSPIWSSLLLSE